MIKALQVGNRTLGAEEIISLLASYQMLPQFQRELIIDQEITKIECTPSEIAYAQELFKTHHRLNSETDLKAWMAYHGLAANQLETVILRQLRIEKFKQATWSAKVEMYFMQQKAQLDKVIYSLLRIQDMGIAQELYFRIKAQEQSFAELASEYSTGSEAQTGGLIGPIELKMLHPTLVQILSSTQPGQLSFPTRIGESFVIVRLEKFISVQLDEPMKARLLNELFETWIKEQPYIMI